MKHIVEWSKNIGIEIFTYSANLDVRVSQQTLAHSSENFSKTISKVKCTPLLSQIHSRVSKL